MPNCFAALRNMTCTMGNLLSNNFFVYSIKLHWLGMLLSDAARAWTDIWFSFALSVAPFFIGHKSIGDLKIKTHIIFTRLPTKWYDQFSIQLQQQLEDRNNCHNIVLISHYIVPW